MAISCKVLEFAAWVGVLAGAVVETSLHLHCYVVSLETDTALD